LLGVVGGQQPKNGVSHFLAWGLFCGVSEANTAKQTWQTVHFFYHLDFSNFFQIFSIFLDSPLAQRTVHKWHITSQRLGAVAAYTELAAG